MKEALKTLHTDISDVTNLVVMLGPSPPVISNRETVVDIVTKTKRKGGNSGYQELHTLRISVNFSYLSKSLITYDS